MDEIDSLARLFEKFPGIGPRQAKRFVYSLLRADASYRTELVDRIGKLSRGVARCALCGRFMAAKQTSTECTICSNSERLHQQLMIILKDADIESFESTSIYQGTYLVLGTLAPLTEDTLNPAVTAMLKRRLSAKIKIEEIVLALPVTTDGEHTATLVRSTLTALCPVETSVTTLGRGLSTGSELEYADPQTLRNAFALRRK